MTILRSARLWLGVDRSSRGARTAAVDADGLQAFGSEQGGKAASVGTAVGAIAPLLASITGRINWRTTRWVAVLLVITAAIAASAWVYQRRVAARVAVSHLTIETTPAGLEVTIGGEARGRTPLTLDLPPGNYAVQIGAGDLRRVIQATLAPGSSLVQQVELAPIVVTGTLHVETEPAGMPVFVDGVDKGRSPLTIAQLEPGDHQVVAGTARRTRRTVTVRANETVSLIISDAPEPVKSSPAIGWLTVASPLALDVREGGKVIGTTGMDRIILPAGDHTLELVNDALGYRATRRTSIGAGQTARLAVEAPHGTLSINAQPWAEVWLDGRPLGATPIGNISTPIGSHDVVFRHPEFGERRATVSVGAKTPARVGMDMRGK